MRYELKHLLAFVAVAEELNFHRAAERLTMAQPAISRLMSELEERLGVRLLERTTRVVRLTEPGRYFLEEAQSVIERINAAEGNVKRLAAGTKGILRIGYTTINGHSLVPDLVKEYRSKNPDIRLELSYLTAPRQRDKIITGELDAGFMEGSFQSAEIATKIAARHRLMVLLHSAHRLASLPVLSIQEVAEEDVIIGTSEEWPTMRRIVVDAFQTSGHIAKIVHEAPTLTAILGLVTSGVGITVFCGVPRFCGGDNIVARPLITKDPVLVETHMAWRRSNDSVVLRRFLDLARRVTSSNQLLTGS
ncbi:LysR family transcriptional regulator [Agrobacterium rubi]|uniref:LysR substrate-binding domain-containing protein n=1 Tax=Agrobacterium rubi TaxID=28099 RepID=UPI001572913C|nr:LysR substrate-binding domain-containing protein [Agrobacterium rubi]NTF10576.1 LysR family transcriptional regulator [Agrobacterium rubi]NTF22970.1 LysR family transcriptional regulator [Agrobacterium rubi]NTF29901.1 LysR family transcriptional regulator [Agrobacterium rubi]